MKSIVLKLMNIVLYSISHYSHQLQYETHLILISHLKHEKRLVNSDSCTLYSNILSVTRHNTSRTTITLKKD